MHPPQGPSVRSGWWLLLACLPLSSWSQEQTATWRTISGAKVVVRYEEADQRNAATVLQQAEEACSKISDELGLAYLPVLQLIMAPSAEEFASLTHGRLPRWAAGATTLETQGPVIYIPSPRWGASGQDLSRTVVHEVAHALVAVASDFRPLPRWLTEGLAIRFSREQQWTSPSDVSRALLTNSVVPLEEIEQLNSFPEQKARLAYQESFLAVDYLVQTYGLDAMRIILASAAKGQDIDVAFERAIDRDTWEFQQEWLNFVRKRYRWAFLAELDWPLWVLILALAGAAFVAVRLRTRKTVRAWEQEAKEQEDLQPWESE
ncbi:MAG: peptidase MA family metallohydrolase [candidate division KSB1 bacterium]|nr:peptidase MA family metallohydrolase [candidate division KSB1 bacterium]